MNRRLDFLGLGGVGITTGESSHVLLSAVGAKAPSSRTLPAYSTTLSRGRMGDVRTPQVLAPEPIQKRLEELRAKLPNGDR